MRVCRRLVISLGLNVSGCCLNSLYPSSQDFASFTFDGIGRNVLETVRGWGEGTISMNPGDKTKNTQLERRKGFFRGLRLSRRRKHEWLWVKTLFHLFSRVVSEKSEILRMKEVSADSKAVGGSSGGVQLQSEFLRWELRIMLMDA